jgi:hypothetical protein
MAGIVPTVPTAPENVLYVILHGSIVLVDVLKDSKNGFDAYLLDMGKAHQYMYGTWFLEDVIPERQLGQDPMILTLEGVNPSALVSGTNDLNPDLNAVVKLPAAPVINSGVVRALVHLPRPRKIYYFTCGTVEKGSFVGAGVARLVDNKEPSTISGIRVFEYTFDAAAKTGLLAGNPEALRVWDCPNDLAPVGTRRVAVLHIYDEPGTSMTAAAAKQHNLEEFETSLRLLGASFKLTKNPHEVRPAPATLLQPAPADLGILEQELGALGNRGDFMLDSLFKDRSGTERKVSKIAGGGGQICGAGNGLVR